MLIVWLLVALVVVFLFATTWREPFVLPRSKAESARLAELIRRGDKLVDYVRTNQYPAPGVAARIVENWAILKSTNRIGITPADTDTPGFVMNKSDSMQLCLTTKPDRVGDLDDINTATFVLIHEIAHLGAEEFQHGSEFISVFKKLLRAGINTDIWRFTDYAQSPQMYCDYNVNATPTVPEKFSAIFHRS